MIKSIWTILEKKILLHNIMKTRLKDELGDNYSSSCQINCL